MTDGCRSAVLDGATTIIRWRDGCDGLPGMYHYVGRAVPGTALFLDAEEAVLLWNLLVGAAPGLVALYPMVNHYHLQHEAEVGEALGKAHWHFARSRNARRGERGSVWRPQRVPHFLADRQKQRRSERYLVLNGCRAGVETDPLAWPLCTHRDALGLVLRPVRPRVHQPARHPAWISADATTSRQGSDLPLGDGSVLGRATCP